jgi:hypothetical protein
LIGWSIIGPKFEVRLDLGHKLHLNRDRDLQNGNAGSSSTFF